MFRDQVIGQMRKQQSGFSLIELMIAISVLAVGMAALMPLFAVAVLSNGRSKTDTTATMLAQTVLEKIAAQPAAAATANINIVDCNSAGATTWTIGTANGAGAPLTVNNDIDFAQNTVPNYNMQFVACGKNSQQAVYDVRWNIQAIAGNGSRSRIITVAARPSGAGSSGNKNQALIFAVPVTLRTIGGQ